jgi:G3E family GTPase
MERIGASEIEGMLVDIVYGFLGSGKTTFITRILKEWGADEKIVVLVNEFGEVGIDGDLLMDQGGDVVEMPSGCICCTLQTDFRTQLLDISRTICPERVIIEPTGVATIAQVRSIIEAQLFEDVMEEIHNILIADGTGFMRLYKANRHFVESQVENANLVLLNKCDLVDKRTAIVTQGAISSINPDIPVLMTEFGAVDWAEYQMALSTASGPKQGGWKDEQEYTVRYREETHITATVGELHPHSHESQEEEDALGYESFGCIYEDLSFDQMALENLFQDLNTPNSQMGEIVRAKGIFQIGDKWILMELASGEFSSQPIRKSSQSKLSIIGKGLNQDMIGAALNRCLSGGSGEKVVS